MQIKCLTCGKEFKRKASKVARSKEHFCSLSCKANAVARFWRNVYKTDTCWLWIGPKMVSGHGKFRPERTTYTAHRFSWHLHYGPIPEHLCVCHNCPGKDNPSCVNPEHLWLGTRSENISDGVKKGQFRRGESCHTSKLSENIIPEIRKQAQCGMRYTDLAKLYKVRPSTIRSVTLGLTWKHI